MSLRHLSLVPGATGTSPAIRIGTKPPSGSLVRVGPQEQYLAFSVTAQLPAVPAPLQLVAGPLLVTIETWSDGTVVARIPSASLYGEGKSDVLALDALAESTLEFATSVKRIQLRSPIGGGLKKQWEAFMGLVDVSRLTVTDDSQ